MNSPLTSGFEPRCLHQSIPLLTPERPPALFIIRGDIGPETGRKKSVSSRTERCADNSMMTKNPVWNEPTQYDRVSNKSVTVRPRVDS